MSTSITNHRTHQVAFNTGAYYTPHGQRMAAWVRLGDGGHARLCCLVDFDRGICCSFPVHLGTALNTPADLAMHAMHMYRWGQYDLGVSIELAVAARAEMHAVLANGYDAFIQAPEVMVLAGMASRLSQVH